MTKHYKARILLPEAELRKLISSGLAVKATVSECDDRSYVVDVEAESFTARLCNHRDHKARCWLDLDRAMDVVRSLGCAAAEIRFHRTA